MENTSFIDRNGKVSLKILIEKIPSGSLFAILKPVGRVRRYPPGLPLHEKTVKTFPFLMYKMWFNVIINIQSGVSTEIYILLLKTNLNLRYIYRLIIIIQKHYVIKLCKFIQVINNACHVISRCIQLISSNFSKENVQDWLRGFFMCIIAFFWNILNYSNFANQGVFDKKKY